MTGKCLKDQKAHLENGVFTLNSPGVKDRDKQPQVSPEDSQIFLVLAKGKVWNNVVGLPFVDTGMPCTPKLILLEKHFLYYSIGQLVSIGNSL